MEGLLDLSITIKHRSQDISSAPFIPMTVRCDTPNLAHEGTFLTDLLTQEERNRLRWYLEEYHQWPFEGFEQRARQVEAFLPEVGKRLYQAVFDDPAAQSIVKQWWQQPTSQRQITIISDLPGILSLPWELLHDEHGFLALRIPRPVTILRRLKQQEFPIQSVPLTPPLRVLVVTARPLGQGFIDPRSSARELLTVLQESIDAGVIEVEFLRPPTFDHLRQRLGERTRPVHVLHFDGHGGFDGNEGNLLFEASDGRYDEKSGKAVASILQGSGIQLVVLDACQGAVSAEDDAFSSVAAQLLQGGIDGVVAMSASVLVTTSARYVGAFYREVATGTPASVAHIQAQQALHADPRRHSLSRARNTAAEPLMLYDWWMPHFYQQRPLVLQREKHQDTQQQLAALSDIGKEKSISDVGMIGRSFELLSLERHLLNNRLVVIYGFGGIGKTTLVRDAANWWVRTGLIAKTCFVSFEHGGDVTTLFNQIGNALDIQSSDYLPDDPVAALEYLTAVLANKTALIIVDSLETILPGGGACLERDERIELWRALWKLRERGVEVILTTRNPNVGDGYWKPKDPLVAYFLLDGLDPDHAWKLATEVLLEHEVQIDDTRIPYTGLRDFLAEQLGYHPLSIRLVLPALKERTLARIKADLEKLLPDFVDLNATGRNRSLVASLEYSLQQLPEEHRRFLSCFIHFEGGAYEGNLLSITQIPESEWSELRTDLMQAALLTEEFIHKDVQDVFLRFHPTLIPYIRHVSIRHDEELHERYMVCYYNMALEMNLADDDMPNAVHALVRSELPNMYHALRMLLDRQQLEAAVDMSNNVARFLHIFALREKRDELRQEVEAALNATEARSGNALTYARHFFECGRGEEELEEGRVNAAHERFEALLKAIEARLEDDVLSQALGRGSYEHIKVLELLARSLRAGGQLDTAMMRLDEAMALLDERIKRTLNDEQLRYFLWTLLEEFGNVPLKQVIQARGEKLIELGLLPRVMLLRKTQIYNERVIMPLARFVQGIEVRLKERGNEPLKQLKRLRKALLFEEGSVLLEQGNYREAQEKFHQAQEG